MPQLPSGGRKKQGQGFKGRKARGIQGETRAGELNVRIEPQSVEELMRDLRLTREEAQELHDAQVRRKEQIDREVAIRRAAAEQGRRKPLNAKEVEKLAREVASQTLVDAAVQRKVEKALQRGEPLTDEVEDEAQRSVRSMQRRLNTTRSRRSSFVGQLRDEVAQLRKREAELIKDFEEAYGKDWQPRWVTYIDRDGNTVQEQVGGIDEIDQAELVDIRQQIAELEGELPEPRGPLPGARDKVRVADMSLEEPVEIPRRPTEEDLNPYDAIRTLRGIVQNSEHVGRDGRIVRHTSAPAGEAGQRTDLGRVVVKAEDAPQLESPDRGRVRLLILSPEGEEIGEYVDPQNRRGVEMERRGGTWRPTRPGDVEAALEEVRRVLSTKNLGAEEPDVDIHLIPEASGRLLVTAAPVDANDPVRQDPSRGLIKEPTRVLQPRPGEQPRADDRPPIVGAGLNVAGGMLRQTDKPKRARVILHDHTGAQEHIADVKAERKPGKGRGLTYAISNNPGRWTFRWPAGTRWQPTGIGPGRFRARNLSEGHAQFREAFGLSMFERARREIRRAHSQFQIETLRRLFPDVSGPLFEQRYQEERDRDELYLQNMESRLRRGITQALDDPSLSRGERKKNAQGVLAKERAYFRRHLIETAWRMARNAELIRLREAGEPGAYWLLDKGLKKHTQDCLQMEGKVWDWSVLNIVNPANRHPGCGCRLLSVAEARSRGLATPRGSMTPEEAERLVEYRIYVPASGGNRWHDSRTGRFVSGPGELVDMPLVGRAFEKLFDDLQDAAENDDIAGAWEITQKMRRVARRMPHGTRKGRSGRVIWKATPQQDADYQYALRTIQRAYEAVENNTGRRYPMGLGRSLAPIEEKGRLGPWTATGSYQWRVPERATETLHVDRLKGFDARHLPDGDVLLSTRDVGYARELEIFEPALRSQRYEKPDTPLDDERPLDINPKKENAGPNAAYRQERSRVAHVTTRQLGDTAEVLLDDVARRMKSLGFIDSVHDLKAEGEGGNSQAPLDWIMDTKPGLPPLGIEVKTRAFRGITPDIAGPDAKMDRRWVEEKNAAARELGLQPALMMSIADLDNDVVHFFFQPTGIANRRIPKVLMDDFFDGQLRPGQIAFGSRDPNKEHPTMYVGSFRTRFNPLARESVGKHLTGEDMRKLRARRPSPAWGDMGMRDRVNRHVEELPKRAKRPLTDREARQVRPKTISRQERDETIRRFLDNDLNSKDRAALKRRYRDLRSETYVSTGLDDDLARPWVRLDPRTYKPPRSQQALAQDLNDLFGDPVKAIKRAEIKARLAELPDIPPNAAERARLQRQLRQLKDPFDVHQTTISRIKREMEEESGVARPKRRRGPNKPKPEDMPPRLRLVV